MRKRWVVLLWLLPLVAGAVQGAETAGGVTPFTLTGTVTDPEGRPVAGLSLWTVALAEQRGKHDLLPSAVSGPDGSFSIPGLPRGQIDLHACGRAYLPVVRSVWFTDDPVHLEVEPAMMIRGQVLDEDGAPVAGVLLSVTESLNNLGPGEHPPIPIWSPCPPSGAAESGADGRYEIGPFAPGEYDLQVELADFELAPEEPRHLMIMDEVSVDPFDLRLKRLGGRKGSLTDSAGEPVRWTDLTVTPEGGMPGSFHSWDDGSFTFFADPGPVTFRVEQEGYRTFEQTIEISEDETPVDLVLMRDAGWTTIRGRVAEPDGAPIAGATILLLHEDVEARSAADGSFEIQFSSQETEELFVSKEGFSLALLRVDPKAPPAGEITIRLESGARVTGRLLGLTPGDRGPDAELTLKRPGSPGLKASVQADDTFRFENVPAGMWKLAFQGEYRSAHSKMVVKPGQTEVAVDFSLPPPIPVAGRVLDDKGQPVAGAEVIATSNGRDRIDLALTRSDGGFELHVPKGEVQLTAYRKGFLNGQLNVSVAGRRVKGVEIRMEREE
ncbi:MAG TPA: carboxypeptidase-like regulatory domain-containing protein [Thermoanaerobaculia bacterium]|nr:carboxypeptidase-like regulatory domain-containing protein [Thermoanaerobaculia bacterium]